MRTAIMAIGLPGSGKTTILKPFAEAYGLVYINRDDIREEMLGDAKDHSRQKAVWLEATRRTKEALSESWGVVLDGTFLERWKRKEMINFLRDAGATKIVGVVFDVPAGIARARNAERTRVVSDDVMTWMEGQSVKEPAGLEEGFDALYSHIEFGNLNPETLLADT